MLLYKSAWFIAGLAAPNACSQGCIVGELARCERQTYDRPGSQPLTLVAVLRRNCDVDWSLPRCLATDHNHRIPVNVRIAPVQEVTKPRCMYTGWNGGRYNRQRQPHEKTATTTPLTMLYFRTLPYDKFVWVNFIRRSATVRSVSPHCLSFVWSRSSAPVELWIRYTTSDVVAEIGSTSVTVVSEHKLLAHSVLYTVHWSVNQIALTIAPSVGESSRVIRASRLNNKLFTVVDVPTDFDFKNTHTSNLSKAHGRATALIVAVCRLSRSISSHVGAIHLWNVHHTRKLQKKHLSPLFWKFKVIQGHRCWQRSKTRHQCLFW